MPYQYDETEGWYFNSETGERLSNNYVRDISLNSIFDSQETTNIIADLFDQGAAGWQEVYDSSWFAIKDEYIRQYLLAYGGRERMTQADWGRIGAMLREQKGYFNPMLDDLASGAITPGEFARRMRMYINSSNESYWKARSLEMKRLGYEEVKWNLGATENHCGVCPEIASAGWQPACEDGGFPFGGDCHFPGDGNTPCLTECKCGLDYRRVDGEVFGD